MIRAETGKNKTGEISLSLEISFVNDLNLMDMICITHRLLLAHLREV